MKGSALIAVLALALVLGPPRVAKAQDVGTAAISAGLADLVGSDLIQKFRQTGQVLLDQANSSGNALIARAANEANVTAQNISFLLKDQQNVAFKNLDTDEQKLIVQAELTREKLSKIADTAYDMKDTTAVDLNYLVSAFPFVQNRFFVQRISGLSYLDQPGDYSIRVIASTLGVQEDIATTIAVALNGRAVSDATVDQSQQHGVATITLPNGDLKALFDNTSLKIVPAKLTFTVKRRTFWSFLTGPQVNAYDVPIYISLYPHLAATVTVSGSEPKYDWVDIGPKSGTISTPDRNCSSHCHGQPTAGPNTIAMSVSGGPAPYMPGYQRFEESTAHFSCTSANDGCPFSNEGGSHDTSPVFSDNDTNVALNWSTWGHGTQSTLTVNVARWQQTRQSPYSVGPQPIDFGSVAMLDLPGNRSTGTMHVTTFTKHSYDILVGDADPNNLIQSSIQSHSCGPLGDQDCLAIQAIAPTLN
ncbi:MAG: hypothetical protein P4L73_07320 [Caulobacteraceae bacterium]|nr:hypothetical protein [Caulobacteraceae bacterium]